MALVIGVSGGSCQLLNIFVQRRQLPKSTTAENLLPFKRHVNIVAFLGLTHLIFSDPATLQQPPITSMSLSSEAYGEHDQAEKYSRVHGEYFSDLACWPFLE